MAHRSRKTISAWLLPAVLLLTASSLPAQLAAGYSGTLSFDYTGALAGTFSADGEFDPDSLIIPSSFAGGTVLTSGDTTRLLIPAFRATTTETFDVFLVYLRDDSGGLDPQTWTLPDDAADLRAVAAFLPDLDSAFVADLLAVIIDTTGGLPSLDSLLEQVLTEIAPVAYFAASGSIVLEQATADTLTGSFSGAFVKTAFPPPVITVSNGRFDFGSFSLPEQAATPENALPQQFILHPAYPNPFNAAVTLEYDLAQPAAVRLDVFDLTGRSVAELYHGPAPAGRHVLVWTAGNQSSGIYIVRLECAGISTTQRVVLLK